MATAPKSVPKVVPKPAPANEAEAVQPMPKSKWKSKKRLLIIAAATLLLAGGAGGAWFYLQDGKAPRAAKVVPPAPPIFSALEPFTVNLRSENGAEQYLQVAFTLQVASQEEANTIKLHMPQVRSRVLLLLSNKTAAELASLDGKKKLADDIIAQIRQPFAPKAAALNPGNVFFTSFVIQ